MISYMSNYMVHSGKEFMIVNNNKFSCGYSWLTMVGKPNASQCRKP